MDASKIITEVLKDLPVAIDLFSKIRTNISQAKEVLKNNPDASLIDQLAEAQAKLHTIQEHANQADKDFDEAFAALKAGGS